MSIIRRLGNTRRLSGFSRSLPNRINVDPATGNTFTSGTIHIVRGETDVSPSSNLSVSLSSAFIANLTLAAACSLSEVLMLMLRLLK